MGLKILNIDKEADRELITTFVDRTTAPLDDEPAEAFDAYVAYYLSPLWIEDYKTADLKLCIMKNSQANVTKTCLTNG